MPQANRRIVSYQNVTADGYFAAADGGLDWVVPEDKIQEQAVASMQGQGAMLLGRRTYDQFESFWPQALNDPDGARNPHRPAQRSAAMQRMAVWINEAEKVVISKTRTSLTWQNSRRLADCDPRQIAKLKQEAGSDLMVFGSASIVSQLTQHKLIDEYQFVVSPILLGNGRQLVREVPQHTSLKLLEAKSFASGCLLLRYAPAL